MPTDIIIVGAGAAGLMAARELGKAGKKVIVLEARDRIGGRIYPLPEADWGYEAAGGAEFIHGDAPITKSLVKEIGLTLTNPTEWWSIRDGEPSKLVERLSPHDPLLEEKLKELTEDIPVAEFLEKNFPREKYDALWDFVCRWTEGYDAADPAKASTFGLREEMLDEGTWLQTNIKEGYGPILRHLEQECRANGVEFVLNSPVSAIDFSGEQVAVLANGTSYQSARVLITVPLPLLSEISFTPGIPDTLAAVGQIGYGHVIKMLLRFKTKWWTGVREQLFDRMFFMLSSEPVPTWWTQYPEERPVLTGWLPGPQALALSPKSDEDILLAALESLSKIFTISVDELRQELVHYKIVNWPRDPYARGVYSYATPWSAAAITKLQEPIEGKLYLAGEAISFGHGTGTVEAALESGQRTAQAILKA